MQKRANRPRNTTFIKDSDVGSVKGEYSLHRRAKSACVNSKGFAKNNK